MEFRIFTWKAAAAGVEAVPATGRQALVEGAQNLLKHIPGEASGYYLMAVDSLTRPSLGMPGFNFAFSLL